MANYLEPRGRVETSFTPDGRKRIRRESDVKAPGVEPANIVTTLGDYGAADAEFTDCRLVDRFIAKSPTHADEQIAVVVFEELPANDELQVGGDDITVDENGRRTITRRFLQFSSGTFTAGTTGSTISALSTTFALHDVQKSEPGKVRTIIRRYLEATATLVQVGSDSIDTEINGLRRRTQLLVGTAAAADPSGTVGTTTHGTDTTLILAGKKVERSAALTKAVLVWMQPGIISKQVDTRDYGLRLEAWTSVGVKQTPAGIVMSESESNVDGFTQWTVVCMQSSTGASPTAETFEYDALTSFVYPGRAKAYDFINGGTDCYDVFLSPPVESRLLARVKITYQTADTVGALTYPLWNPTEWATMTAAWIGWNQYPRVKVEGLRGYRAENNYSAASFTSDATGYDTTVFGDRVYGSTSGSIIVSGGPQAPDNLTLTLDAKMDLAFVDKDGVKYHRRTVVEVTVPPQTPLPVSNPPAVVTGVTSFTTLRAVATPGLTLGARTNFFTVSWTPGGGIMITQQVRGYLRAGTDAEQTTSPPFIIRPTDYATTTNERVWVVGP